MAETFWVLAGEDKIDPLMNFFLPRAKDFSDDGLTWHDAYGPRLYEYAQFQNVIGMFEREGPNTRRAVMGIWDVRKDTLLALNEKGNSSVKAIPCNNFIYYWIRDNKLNMKVCQRSADLIWGTSNINLFEFTVLQEVMLNLVNNALRTNTEPDFELGYYHHSIVSFHVYNETIKQAENIVKYGKENELLSKCKETNFNLNLGPNINSNNLQKFFIELYTIFCDTIKAEINIPKVWELFNKWDIPKLHNSLYSYALLVEEFILHKRNIKTNFNIKHNPYLSTELKSALMYNKFTPESWK